MPTVLIIAQDWSLRTSIRAQLREEGIAALGMETLADAAQELARGAAPSAIVVEGEALQPGETLATLSRGVPVVIIASNVFARNGFPTAAAVLFRPVRVAEVVACVQRVLRGQAA